MTGTKLTVRQNVRSYMKDGRKTKHKHTHTHTHTQKQRSTRTKDAENSGTAHGTSL